jgi:hypothetical protein
MGRLTVRASGVPGGNPSTHLGQFLYHHSGYVRQSGSTTGITPSMTTDYVFRASHTDRKPGRVLRVLQTAQGTTRSPAYVR